MLVRKKKLIKNLINLNSSTFFTSLIKENKNTLCSLNIKKIKKNTLLYKKVNDYLSQNNYFLIEEDLIKYLNTAKKEIKKKLRYKEIDQLPKIIKNILTSQLFLLIKEEYAILLEKEKIEKKINLLKSKKDISINKYYPLTENTQDETIALLNEEINKLHNEKVFIAFNLTLQSQNKVLSKILKSVKRKNQEKNLLLNNIIYSINLSEKLNLEKFYLNLLEMEKLLNKDKFYQMMPKESKDIYRKKIQKKRNPLKFCKNIIIEKKDHIGFHLFKKPSVFLRLDYTKKEIPNNSKTTVNLFKKFMDKEQIDSFIIDLSNNKAQNINFNIINKNKNLEIELISYLNKKCNLLNESPKKKTYQFYQEKDKIFYSKNIKYVMNINEIDKVEITKIKYLIGIIDHPLNKITLNKNKTRVKKGYALLSFPIINKEKNMYKPLYQKDETLLNHNEIYNMLIEEKLSISKNSILRNKVLNAKYQKEIFFTNDNHNDYTTYLKHYHHFIQENIRKLKKRSSQNKKLLLSNLKREILYLFFLIGIFFHQSLTILIIEIIFLVCYHHSLIKAINEYAHIPEYLSFIIIKKKKNATYLINIIIGFIFLLMRNLIGIIFLISLPLSYIINKTRKEKQILTSNESEMKNENTLTTSILSTENLSLYIDNQENETIRYKANKLLTTNYFNQLKFKNIDQNEEITFQDSNIILTNNKAKIIKENKEMKLTVETILSELAPIEIKKLIIENKTKQINNISVELLLSLKEDEQLINPSPVTIKKKDFPTYITTYFFNTEKQYFSKEKTTLKIKNLKVEQKKELYLVTIISENQNIESLVNQYTKSYIKSLFTLTKEKKITTNYLLLTYLTEINQYKINEARKKLLNYNSLTPNYLEKFKMNPHIPIMILNLRNTSNKKLLKETLLFFIYTKKHNFPLHLIILNNIDKKYINDLIYHIEEENKELKKLLGEIYFFNDQILSSEEIILFYTLSYLTIDATLYQNLTDYLTKLTKNLKKVEEEKYKKKESLILNNLISNKLEEKKEFILTDKERKSGLLNIIASPTSLKTITTPSAENNTYLNSKTKLSFKEKIIINNTDLNFNTIKYGLGYTTYLAKTKKLDIELTEFISYFEKTKFYKLTIKNNSNELLTLSIKYIIYPALIEDFPNSSRYVLCKYDDTNNLITMQNKLNQYFFRNTCYITCTEKIKNTNLSNPSKKIIEIKKSIPRNSSKELAFTLGIADLTYLNFLKEKYSNIATINTAHTISTNYFKTMLNKIKVKTNNQIFNDELNHHLLYKIITTNIFQSSNTQCLRNSLNIISIFPSIAKDTIINNIQKDLTIIDLFYLIYTTSIYLEQSEQTEILSEKISNGKNLYHHLKTKVTEILQKKEVNQFYLYIILELFIKLSKLYNKNIDNKKLKEKLNTIKKDLLKDKKKTTKIYRILLGITTNKEEKLTISKKIPKYFENKEILYLYFLLKEKEYDLLFEQFQNIVSFNKKENKDLYLSNLYQIGLEEILGFKRKNKKLYIKPHLPSSIKNYQLTYQYLNTTYYINVIINKKQNTIIINNQVENINYIELKNDYKTHNIDIYIKEK